MPIFEYRCERCGHAFETLVTRSEAAPACPRCGGDRVAKQWSTFAVTSPGTGASNPGPCGSDDCACRRS